MCAVYINSKLLQHHIISVCSELSAVKEHDRQVTAEAKTAQEEVRRLESWPHQTLGTFNAKALHFTNNCATTRIWWMLWLTSQQNVIYISCWLGLNTCPYCTHAAEASIGWVAQEREPAGRVPRLVRAAAKAPRETRRQPHRRERNLEYGRLQPGAQGTLAAVSN